MASSSSSSSLLRVMCLHDARSNSLELSRKLNALGERLYQKHGIDLVFVDAPLIVEGGPINTNPEDEAAAIQDHHPWRAWWEKETEEPRKNRSLEEPDEDKDETDSSTEPNQKSTNSEPTNNETNNTPPRYVGLDASLLLLKQIWASSPFWGILAVGQAAGVASLLPLLPSTDGKTPQPPSFMIFVHGESLLEQDEALTEHLNLPCLHIVDGDPIPDSITLRLIHQFGGDVVSDRSLSFPTSPCSSGAFNNHVGRFLVARKKDLKKSTADIAVLALRHELHRTEADAAHLVARHIAQNPPDALMAVITPKDVGGFRDKRRGPNEEGGGAPCPSEFLLHRTKRTTTKSYQASDDDDSKATRDSEASRHHPNQQQQER